MPPRGQRYMGPLRARRFYPIARQASKVRTVRKAKAIVSKRVINQIAGRRLGSKSQTLRDSVSVKLKATTYDHLTGGGVSGQSAVPVTIRLGTPYDPEYAIGGQSAVYETTLHSVGLYNKLICIGCKVEYTINNNSANSSAQFLLNWGKNTQTVGGITVSGDMIYGADSPRTIFRRVGTANSGHDFRHGKFYVNIPRVAGMSFKDYVAGDDNWIDPGQLMPQPKEMWLNMFFSTDPCGVSGGVNGFDMGYSLKLTYYCLLKNLGQPWLVTDYIDPMGNTGPTKGGVTGTTNYTLGITGTFYGPTGPFPYKGN